MAARGACVAAGGHAWQLGGVCGSQGVCMAARVGHVLQVGGVHGGGHVWLPGGGACMRYDEIRSMSGQYASYWNALLLKNCCNCK